MVLMRLRELGRCPRHNRTLVVLEDVAGSCRLTFYADPEEARRLARALERSAEACHPVYDFIHALLGTLGGTALRVVLEDVRGRGVGALVHVQQGAAETVVPCYPPDAIALALRARLPIYATRAALRHAERLAPGEWKAGEIADWVEQVRPQDFQT